MSNPNLNSDKESLNIVDREFENNIRPAVINDFAGQSPISRETPPEVSSSSARSDRHSDHQHREGISDDCSQL